MIKIRFKILPNKMPSLFILNRDNTKHIKIYLMKQFSFDYISNCSRMISYRYLDLGFLGLKFKNI